MDTGRTQLHSCIAQKYEFPSWNLFLDTTSIPWFNDNYFYFVAPGPRSINPGVQHPNRSEQIDRYSTQQHSKAAQRVLVHTICNTAEREFNIFTSTLLFMQNLLLNFFLFVFCFCIALGMWLVGLYNGVSVAIFELPAFRPAVCKIFYTKILLDLRNYQQRPSTD